jgi:hypothetical protein
MVDQDNRGLALSLQLSEEAEQRGHV